MTMMHIEPDCSSPKRRSNEKSIDETNAKRISTEPSTIDFNDESSSRLLASESINRKTWEKPQREEFHAPSPVNETQWNDDLDAPEEEEEEEEEDDGDDDEGIMNKVDVEKDIRGPHNDELRDLAMDKQWFRALEKLKDMRNEGVEPDAISYSFVIKACRKGKRWRLALELLEEMELKGLVPNSFCYSSVIRACADQFRWQEAAKVFAEMQANGVQPDISAYNALLSAYDKARQWRKALQLIGEMQKDADVEPNLQSYNMVIAACARACRPENALRLFKEMRQISGVAPDVMSYNWVIDSFSKRKKWEAMSKFVDEMKMDKSVAMNTTTYNSMMKVCGRAKRYDVIHELYLEMKREGVKCDVISFVSAIIAVENLGQWDVATEWFSDMIKEGVRHTVFSYRMITSVITSGQDRSAHALRFLNGVREHAALTNIIFEQTEKVGDSKAKNNFSQDNDIVSNTFLPLSSV